MSYGGKTLRKLIRNRDYKSITSPEEFRLSNGEIVFFSKPSILV